MAHHPVAWRMNRLPRDSDCVSVDSIKWKTATMILGKQAPALSKCKNLYKSGRSRHKDLDVQTAVSALSISLATKFHPSHPLPLVLPARPPLPHPHCCDLWTLGSPQNNYKIPPVLATPHSIPFPSLTSLRNFSSRKEEEAAKGLEAVC